MSPPGERRGPAPTGRPSQNGALTSTLDAPQRTPDTSTRLLELLDLAQRRVDVVASFLALATLGLVDLGDELSGALTALAEQARVDLGHALVVLS